MDNKVKNAAARIIPGLCDRSCRFPSHRQKRSQVFLLFPFYWR
ncbi:MULTISPECIES: hypothetical protein [unclassified Nostoc]|nr:MULTISPECIES: hypothetical protein [unclassified Nostoc]MDM9584126.1 hypothetical protein [Nostoc sp. GT001]MDZ7945265.1 hypothetical protein [Nostoc sp. EfeVER01]MDZ7995309.1 hypothetical protein [Nostoc sp. EspVER01]